jgi:hypothetical protein
MIELLIIGAVLVYVAVSYNFFWMLSVVGFQLLFAKSLAFKIALLLVAGWYVYEGADYLSYALHLAPVQFDLLKERGR